MRKPPPHTHTDIHIHTRAHARTHNTTRTQRTHARGKHARAYSHAPPQQPCAGRTAMAAETAAATAHDTAPPPLRNTRMHGQCLTMRFQRHSQGCIQVATHTHTHARTRIHTHGHTHTRAHTHTRTHARTHTHTHSHTHTHARKHANTRTRTYTHTRADTHTHTNTHTHACKHTHTRTRKITHTHTCGSSQCQRRHKRPASGHAGPASTTPASCCRRQWRGCRGLGRASARPPEDPAWGWP